MEIIAGIIVVVINSKTNIEIFCRVGVVLNIENLFLCAAELCSWFDVTVFRILNLLLK